MYTLFRVPVFLLALASSVVALHVPTRASEILPRDGATTVTIPLSAPASAPTLGRSLMSFSIEGDRWPDWVSESAPRTYFTNLLKNLGDITGRMPDVRIGANTEDRTTFDSKVNVVQATFPAASAATPYPEADAIRVNSKYYALSRYLPAGAHVVWGVNFGSGTVANAVAQTKSILATFGTSGAAHKAGVILESIEIGNEADLYVQHKIRSSGYSIGDYVSEWKTFAKAVSAAAHLTAGDAPTFWIGSFSFTGSYTGTKFSPQGLYSAGILTGSSGKFVDTYSQHHYQSTACNGGQSELVPFMSKATIRSNISLFTNDIIATNKKHLTYIFGETNSVSCHGAPGVSNVAGAAIWAIDYSLHAASVGVRRLYFHNGIGYRYSQIQPETLKRSTLNDRPLTPPLTHHIQPQYYANIVVNSFIGNSHSNTISTHITELTIPNSDHVSGYAAYDNGKLARAIFINTQAYLTTTRTPRGAKTISIQHGSAPGKGAPRPKSMRIRRLAIGHADDSKGLKFAGKSYETASGLPSGSDKYVDVSADSTVKVSDTEAVLITFGY